MSDSAEFAAVMPQVAELVLGEFLGEKNRHLSSSTEWRWGNNGSVAVDLQKGVWADHEDHTGGGVLDLLKAFKGFEKPEALEWLQDKGFIKPRQQRANGRANGVHSAGPTDTIDVPDWMEHKPIALFEYHDDKGALAYQVLKFPKEAPRRYMQRRPHSQGGWVWGLQGGLYGKIKSGDWFKAKAGKKYEAEETLEDASRWLYRRDEVLKASAAGERVFLCEGEKDVETLRAWGLTATTNAGGAKYWDETFDRDLTGADVVILPDNDDAGRDRATIRGGGLFGKAKSVKVLDIAAHWAEAPAKADVTDWRDLAGGTADRFADVVRKARPWRPERTRAFGAYYHDEIEGPGLQLDYVIDGWLASRGRSVMGGPSGSGKSFLALHAAYCIARGIDFFGYHVEQGGVIYQAGEGGLGMKKRQRAYVKHFEIENADELPLVVLPAKVDLFSRDGDTDRLISAIKQARLTMAVPLRVVFIDTLSTATIGADENSGKDMGFVLANIARIEEECGVHVCLVHHMNADGKKLRGHTSIHANVDTVIQVTNEETTKIKTARLRKQKDDEDGLEVRFTLPQVVIGINPKTGRDLTSCVVMTVSEREKLKQEAAQYGFSVKPSEEAHLIPLFKAIDKYGKLVTDASDGPSDALGKQGVDFGYFLDVAVEMDATADDKSTARERIRKSFERTMRFLIKNGVIGFKRTGDRTAFVWWTGRPIRGFPQTFPDNTPERTNSGHSLDKHTTNPAAPLSPGERELFDDPEIPL
ncbi:AAA family ATPase [Mesorhizobium sp. Z1-4]|uniref:AAA family ATPase n=1 Tax=Mesorhizobium sp. Z1-4 TaxID=2448478 RepID=UPI000FD96416|nr:AAA family ATPase [Mesorhizobium sp. Z1-4]